MVERLRESFNGGVAGQAIQDADIAHDQFNTTTGLDPFYDATSIDGILSARISVPSTGGYLQLRNLFSTGATTTRTVSRYWRFAGNPTTNSTIILQMKLGGTNRGQVVLRSAKTMAIRDVSSVVDTSNFTLQELVWYRLVWKITGGTQTLEIRDGSTDAILDTLSGTIDPGTFDSCVEGLINSPNAALDTWIDECVDDDTITDIAPYSAQSPPPPSANPWSVVIGGIETPIASMAYRSGGVETAIASTEYRDI